MPLTPHHFVNQDHSSNVRGRVHPEQDTQQTTAEKIEAMLQQLGMSKEELIELVAALLGMAGTDISMDDQQVTVTENGVSKSLEEATNEDQLLAILDQLDLLQRLRILAANGHEIDISELEALIAATEGRLDKKTLQMVIFHQQQEMRRFLNGKELEAIRDAVSRAEHAYVIADTITSSGDGAMQKRVLEEVNQRAMPQGQKLEMGKDNQLYVRYQQQTQQQSEETVTRLIREDYRMDMKRLLDATKAAVASVFSAMRQTNRKEGPRREKGGEDAKRRKSLQEDQTLAKELQQQEQEREQEHVLYREATKNSERVKEELHRLDYASDMRAALKAAMSKFRQLLGGFGKGEEEAGTTSNKGGNKPSALRGRRKDHWERDEHKRHMDEEVGPPEEAHFIEDKPGVIMDKKGAEEATAKDQKKLVKLDVIHDREALVKEDAKSRDGLKQLASESRHAVAKDTMQKASVEVGKLSGKEALAATAATMAKGGGLSNMSEASLDKVGESLDKVKDYKQQHGMEKGK